MAKIHNVQHTSVLREISLSDFMYEKLREGGNKECMKRIASVISELDRSSQENNQRLLEPLNIDATNHKSMTYKDVLVTSQNMAHTLRSLGMSKNDVISFYVYNSMELGCLLLACFEIEAVVNTINPYSTQYELQHYLAEVKPQFIFTESALSHNVSQALNVISLKPHIIQKELLQVLEINTENDDVIKKRPQTSRKAREHVALVLFSSGTTGPPKGVLLTDFNIVSYLILKEEMVRDRMPITLNSREICPFPMYHAGGLYGGFLSSVSLGKVFIFFEKYNLELLLQTVQKYQPDGFYMPPSVVVQLTKSPLVDKYDMSSIKYCRMGAAPVQQETEIAFAKRFNNPFMVHGFGLSENTGGALRRGVQLQHKTGSVGKPFPGMSIKVIDPDTQQILGPSKPGEICVRSPCIMKGYLNRPDATSQSIDNDGWLHTGDVGYYDDEDCFYIVDRLKELIKYKGHQVAPAELEAVLLDHPDVADCGVIGIADEVAGELPRAYVVLRNGATITGSDIIKHVQERSAYYKWLRGGVVFVEEIPKLPSGKILRRQLREMARNSKL